MISTSDLSSVKHESIDKFIAFFDVLGWKSLVLKTEQQNNASLSEVIDVLDMIRRELQTREKLFKQDRSEICPCAPRKKPDMDFCFTTSSDSVVISTEISPAGLINLMNCCRIVYFKLIMRKGLMCSGYVKRGLIYHTNLYCVGSGLNDVVNQEKNVSIFKTDTGERGTPFIELDRNVLQFIDDEVSDSCVKKVLSSIVMREGGIAAIFPFKNLNPDIFGYRQLNPAKVRRDIGVIRNWIEHAKRIVNRNVDPRSESACQKGRCLSRMLDARLSICQQCETTLDEAMESFPSHSFVPEYFPGLFNASSPVKATK